MITFREFTDPVTEVEQLAARHAALDAFLSPVDPGAATRASRLPGWSVAHVVAHIAQNADSHRALLDGRPQYDGGWEGRNLAIAEGAARSWAGLTDELSAASAALDGAFRTEIDWDRPVPLLSGERAAGFLPLARRREVEVHWIDLGLGQEIRDVPLDYVERDLPMLASWWMAARGETALPPSVSERDHRGQWAWLVGRLDVEGVPSASLF